MVALRFKRKKRLRILKIFTLINIILLLFNILSYFFLTGPEVFRIKAQTVSMLLTVQEVEAPPPIQPEQPSQGNYNPPTQPPVIEQELPTWLKITQVNNLYLDDLIPPYQFTEQTLTIQGQTNINNAVIFLQLNDQPSIIYTTWANPNGNWEWTTPYLLNIASYELYVWAINPASPEYTADDRLEFQIVEIALAIPPEITPTTVPPIIPPAEIIPPEKPVIITYPEIVPREIYLAAKEFYHLTIKVLNKDHQLFPKEKIILQTDVVKLKPPEEIKVEIQYIISDANEQIILETSRKFTIKQAISFIQNFQTSFNIPAGKYFIEARIERDNKLFIANDFFLVKEKPIVFGSMDLGITQQDLAKILIIIFLLLLIILIIFCLLLIWEYQQSLKDKHISEKDLEKDDYLDLG